MEVVDLRIEDGEVRRAVDPEQRPIAAVAAGKAKEVIVMPRVDGFAVGAGGEALGCVIADGLEHREPRAPRARYPNDQALGDERAEDVKPRPGHRLGGRHRRAANEHREARKALLLGGVE